MGVSLDLLWLPGFLPSVWISEGGGRILGSTGWSYPIPTISCGSTSKLKDGEPKSCHNVCWPNKQTWFLPEELCDTPVLLLWLLQLEVALEMRDRGKGGVHGRHFCTSPGPCWTLVL